MLFDQLNELSEIPIHRSSKKISKIGSGVVYYNNVNDLIDRLELLGGSIIAGNNGVQAEFSQIAYTLNKLGAINDEQLTGLLKEYAILYMDEYKERSSLYKRWPCSTYILNRVN